MRITGGGHTTLGEEAAAAVMRAAALATRRGHAQVTPLHVASAVLSASPALLLRTASDNSSRSTTTPRSSNNPLRYCSALGVCLGVALDRLAVVLAPHGYCAHVPAPSNALVAALKRAQQARRSRRRRGGGGDLERLVASVLDDPSVDRAVRAAASFADDSLQLVGAGCDGDPTNPPAPACTNKIRVGEGGGQPSTLDENHRELQPVVAHVVTDGSEIQANQGTAHAGSAFFDGTEVLATPAATFPAWFRRYQDTLLAGSTHCVGAASLQAAHHHRGQWKFTEITAENLKALCGTLELRVPRRHRGVVPGISSVVLRCRSGMARNKPNTTTTTTTTTTSPPSSSTWLLFRGRSDDGGMTAVARELARLVFGSYSEFTALECNSSSGSGELGLKRPQRPWDADGGSGCVGERLFEAIRENPHRVILVSGVDRLDRDSETLVKNAAKEGTVKGRNGEAVNLEDAIVVLTTSSGAAVVEYSSSSAVRSPRAKKRRIGTQDREERGDLVEMGVRSGRFSFDLNACAEEEDGEEEEEEDDDLADQEAGIVDFVDGVFCFD